MSVQPAEAAKSITAVLRYIAVDVMCYWRIAVATKKVQHVELFMRDGPQKCVKQDHTPCSICGGAYFTLTSVTTGGTWNCYTHMYEHPQAAASKRHKNVISFSEYKAKKANVSPQGPGHT